ncbi:MAG: heme NO-binding domain-containing protein [Acidisphaera sp.]|nr:heme NO-binding domain-containing protein [Acidisphaera sp.]
MKGVVFNLLEEVVTRHHGEAVWDTLLDEAGLAGSYTSLGSYPDGEMQQLVLAASSALSLKPAAVLRWFGREAMPLLAGRYPAFFDAHQSVMPFILSVNGIIHPEVRKLYSGAHCPNFSFEETPDGALLMGYDSPRRLCGLAHGFIEGAANHYDQAIEVAHLQCMHQGDPRCLLRISLT